MLTADIKSINIRNGSALLSGVSFSLEKNAVHTVLGLNGSGKSTLIKSLTNLLDKNIYSVSGSVMFEDKDLLSLDINDLNEVRRDKIKYVFQDAVNSFDHLKRFGYYFERLAKDENDIEELLEYFLLPGRDELAKLYPYEVSGGMAQRINFIVALLTKPRLIILDEPTSGIDSAISNLFLLKLKEFAAAEDHAALLVTHDLIFSEKISDRIAFLSNGRLSEFKPAGEFFGSEKDIALESFLDAHNRLSL